MKPRVFLADLTHTAKGTSVLFPLGVGFLASYAQTVLGDDFDFKVFKFPETLSRAVIDETPIVLACANYSWNLELTYKLASWAKAQCPKLIVILGGPNFPVAADEKARFLTRRPSVDFYIENEGEVGFVGLLNKLLEYDLDAAKLKQSLEVLPNCNYLVGDKLVAGQVQRIKDINIIPSPYLTGILDEYFNLLLVPMIETTRGCPFSCTFCTDGLPIKNKVARFNDERVRDELYYIAQRVKNVDELLITDLNYGMYKADIQTSQYIAEIQQKYHWPILVKATAGKNQTERIIETAKLLKGSWTIGSAIQSSDQGVLTNIKRSNISQQAYQEFVDYMNSLDKEASTYTEIILALPGDTKEKHFESLRYGLESGSNSFRMNQAILLPGTEMATQQTREKFGLVTKFRIIPGGVGIYKFGSDEVPVAEIEEIIVRSKDMSLQDYISCRVMNLFIETYVNNGLCEEVFVALKTMGVSVFDILVYLFEHDELYTPKVKEILARYIVATKDNLYDTHEDAEEAVLHTELLRSYISGELGTNELLEHRAQLYAEIEDTLTTLTQAVKNFLGDKGLLDGTAEDYFDQLREFLSCRKKGIQNTELVIEGDFKYDFKDIQKLDYQIDLRNTNGLRRETRLRFFHSEFQKQHIQNAINVYRNHPDGMARMFQRVNLKKMYRQFERV
jgi:tRNA A37 methylthiotransferase MiaB